MRRHQALKYKRIEPSALQSEFTAIREPLAFWSRWLSLVNHSFPLRSELLSRPARLGRLVFLFEVHEASGLRRIRHNRGVAIYQVPVRVRAVTALL
jgi:hypothetical protein